MMKKIAIIRTIGGTEIEYDFNKIAEVQNYVMSNPKGFLKLGDNMVKINTISEIISTEREFTVSELYSRDTFLLKAPEVKRASVEFAEKIGKLTRKRIEIEKNLKSDELLGDFRAMKKVELEEIKLEMAKEIEKERKRGN